MSSFSHNSPELSASSDNEESFSDNSEKSTIFGESNTGAGVFEEIDKDADAPRVARWVDEDELEEVGTDGEDGNDNDGRKGTDPPMNIKSLQKDLSSLPLGALRKAQRALTEANVDSDSEHGRLSADDGGDFDEDMDGPSVKGKEKFKPEWNVKRRTDFAKRSSKHAPTEVTSKRPVTRRRTVVDVKTMPSRDPRFLPLAGQFSEQKFKEKYGFLVDVHVDELKALKDNLKRARRLLISSPQGLRPEREHEVNRLEMAVKRAESTVNRDRREKVDQEALNKKLQEEREKRKQGKGKWWMKESDKKDLLVRARYEALAAGGEGAVRKAMEKKQKKIGQKEKKSRPFARGQAGKRPSSGSREDGGKRRRVEDLSSSL